MDDTVRVIHTIGRGRAAIYALVMLVMLGLCVWMALHPHESRRYSETTIVLGSTVCAVIFAAGLAATLAQCISPSRLVLSQEGFRFTWVYSIPLVRWSEVEGFGTVPQGAVQHLCFKLTATAGIKTGRKWWRTLAPAGFDGVLFSGSSGTTDRLLLEFREWQGRYGG